MAFSQLLVSRSIHIVFKFLLYIGTEIVTMENHPEAVTCQPEIVKFANRVAPGNLVHNVLRFSRQSGLPSADDVNAFPDFSDARFRKWFELDLTPAEMESFTNDPLVFRGHIAQLRNYVRTEAPLSSNSNRTSTSEQGIARAGPPSQIICPLRISLSKRDQRLNRTGMSYLLSHMRNRLVERRNFRALHISSGMRF